MAKFLKVVIVAGLVVQSCTGTGLEDPVAEPSGGATPGAPEHEDPTAWPGPSTLAPPKHGDVTTGENGGGSAARNHEDTVVVESTPGGLTLNILGHFEDATTVGKSIGTRLTLTKLGNFVHTVENRVYDSGPVVASEDEDSPEGAGLAGASGTKSGQALLHAARRGDRAAVEQLLGSRADTQVTAGHSDTPLNIAASKGHQAVVELLLRARASMEQLEYQWETPLYRAATKGHEAVVDLLLKARASTEQADLAKSRTPLSWAAYLENEAVVDLLLKGRANTESKDNDGQTPLHHAASSSHEAVMLKLVAARANVEATDRWGSTPLDMVSVDLAVQLCTDAADLCLDLLIHAIKGEDGVKASALINAGADPDNCSKSARDLASERVGGVLGPAPPPWRSCKADAFWEMVVVSCGAFLLAYCLSCQHLLRWQAISSTAGGSSRGAERLALQTRYGAFSIAKAFRCLDVFVLIVLPMRLMHYVCVPAWSYLLLATYGPAWTHGQPLATAFTTVDQSIFLPDDRPAACKQALVRALRPAALLCLALLVYHFADRVWPSLLNGNANSTLSGIPHLLDKVLCAPWPTHVGAWDPCDDLDCPVDAQTGCVTQGTNDSGCCVTPRPFLGMLPRTACNGTFEMFFVNDTDENMCPDGQIVRRSMIFEGTGQICPEAGLCMPVAVGSVWLALQCLGAAALVLWGLVTWRVLLLIRLKAPQSEVSELRELARSIDDAPDAAAVGALALPSSGKKVEPVTLTSGGLGCLAITLQLMALDVASDLNSAWTAFSSKHMLFGGLLLGASLYSTGLEVGSGALRALPQEVRATLRRGAMTDGLLVFLEHETGNEALLSLFVSVYALPFTARTPSQMVLGAVSICLSVWGMASFQHSYFDLRLPPPRRGARQLVVHEGEDHDDQGEDESSEDTEDVEGDDSGDDEREDDGTEDAEAGAAPSP